MSARHPLIALASSAPVRRRSEFARAAVGLTGAGLAGLYAAEVEAAPRRHAMGRRGGRYLGGRMGHTSRHSTNRREERLALALFNHGAPLDLPELSPVSLIDHQVPLKACRSDRGVGKIDLLGVDAESRLIVIEVKYASPPELSRSACDTPLRVMLQGLAHCAIAWANHREIGDEIEALGHGPLSDEPPALIVLGNDRYWTRHLTGASADPAKWTRQLERVAAEVASELGVPTRFVALEDGSDLPYGDGTRPALIAPPKLAPAW